MNLLFSVKTLAIPIGLFSVEFENFLTLTLFVIRHNFFVKFAITIYF